jgi:hypothetical protein
VLTLTFCRRSRQACCSCQTRSLLSPFLPYSKTITSASVDMLTDLATAAALSGSGNLSTSGNASQSLSLSLCSLLVLYCFDSCSLLVAGRIIDSSLKSSILFSILAGEREDSGLSSKARAYFGLVFHLNMYFPPDFGSKTPEQKTQNTTK